MAAIYHHPYQHGDFAGSDKTMTPHTAFLYASEFGSYLNNGDAGACFYSFHLNDGRPVSEAHRAQCIARCDALIEHYLRAVKVSPSFDRNLRQLRDLRAFFESTPLYTKAPLSEAGPLALRALQNIRKFVEDQTYRMDDPHNDGEGTDAEPPNGDDWNELASIIMGESLAIVGPPAPRPRPPVICMSLVVNGNCEGREYSSMADAAREAAEWIKGISPDMPDDYRIEISFEER